MRANRLQATCRNILCGVVLSFWVVGCGDSETTTTGGNPPSPDGQASLEPDTSDDIGGEREPDLDIQVSDDTEASTPAPVTWTSINSPPPAPSRWSSPSPKERA